MLAQETVLVAHEPIVARKSESAEPGERLGASEVLLAEGKPSLSVLRARCRCRWMLCVGS